MSQVSYRRRAVLSRIRSALDAFYLLQDIDWGYDPYATLEKIIGLALKEVEFEGGRQIERGLIIIESPSGGELEVHAGWKVEDLDLSFSRTVVEKTIASSESILCKNAKDDPRFMEAESIKGLETLSLISVPLRYEDQCIGAFYIESKNPGNMFGEVDLEFLEDFANTITPYLKTAITHQGHVRVIQQLQGEIEENYRFTNIIGRSQSMRNVFDLMRIATDIDSTVLITGESGSGKELIARAIHYNGARKNNTFVVVDCSSLSEHLLESELFGHRKGAFTSANTDKIGAFEAANRGTIFLDEISDASKALQQKLRRVLQEGEIRRVGDNLPHKVDVRVICAANKNLAEAQENGEFIRDLHFRINKFPIHMPPVRDRREDIPLLVQHFLKLTAEKSEKPASRIQPPALTLLLGRDWAENNVRELRNTVELAVDLSEQGEITREVVERVFQIQKGESFQLPASPTRFDPAPEVDGLLTIGKDSFHRLLDQAGNGEVHKDKKNTPFYRLQLEMSARAIIEGLRVTGWKLRPAARILGISPTKLRSELRDFIEKHLKQAGGDLDRAAANLDIPASILKKKSRDLGLLSMLTGGA